MREDMFEVIVERPRWGHRMGYPRGELKNAFSRSLEDAPTRESYGARYREKNLNENLAPLSRFLRRQVGRRWDDVYSEICAQVDVGSAVQKHVRDHLENLVELRTYRQGGKLWSASRRYGRPWPLEPGRREKLYVCSETGILRALPPAGRRSRPPPDPDLRTLSEWVQLRRIDGQWYRLELALLPSNADDLASCSDLYLREPLRSLPGWKLNQCYGSPDRYCFSKRQLSKRERIRYLGG
jgi:hypothetical protein